MVGMFSPIETPGPKPGSRTVAQLETSLTERETELRLLRERHSALVSEIESAKQSNGAGGDLEVGGGEDVA